MIVSAMQMKQIESNAAELSMSYERMMDNAGSAAAAIIRRNMPVEGRFITIFCGNGNNGGDGFVAARRMMENGANVVVVLTDGEPETDAAKAMYDFMQMMEVAVVNYGDDMQYLADRLASTDILIDAIYGTGFRGSFDTHHSDICRVINGLDTTVVALDVPSGVCADSGIADENAVIANMTITFDSNKPATVMPSCAQHCGQVVVADIGIPPEARDAIAESYVLVDKDYVFSKLQKRERRSHKGTYGKLLCVAGSQPYMGAAILAVLAALRTGAGYVTLASTKEVCRSTVAVLPEAVMLPLAQNPDGTISSKSIDEILAAAEISTAVLVGNGLGNGEDTLKIVEALLSRAKCPVILDADGINCLAGNITILKNANVPVILTPHLGELSRLSEIPLSQLSEQAQSVGREFSQEYGVTIVIKDAYTVTAGEDGVTYINTTGNAGMAKAGSGDVLAGMIGALTAQGHALPVAAACGVFLHGLAGDYAAALRSQYGMLPRDIVDCLTQVFLENER